MSKITKMMLILVGMAMILSTVGCGGSSGGGDGDDVEETIAHVAGIWMVTVDGQTDAMTIAQNGRNLTMTDSKEDVVKGEIYGRDLTFEFVEKQDGFTITLLTELVINNEESPSTMSGAINGYVDGNLFQTIPMTCVRYTKDKRYPF